VSPQTVTPFVDAASGIDDPWAEDAVLLQAAHDTHVLIRIADDRYAVPLDAVAQVQPVPEVTRVPGAPRWLVGVANCRGRVLAVADARLLLGVDAHPFGTSARLLVVTADGLEVGLLVDAVDGLLPCEGAPGPVPATVGAQAAALLAGVIVGEGPVALLDVAAVLALRGSAASAPSA
jgi:purine-binding chemotaxis protein CheW